MMNRADSGTIMLQYSFRLEERCNGKLKSITYCITKFLNKNVVTISLEKNDHQRNTFLIIQYFS